MKTLCWRVFLGVCKNSFVEVFGDTLQPLGTPLSLENPFQESTESLYGDSLFWKFMAMIYIWKSIGTPFLDSFETPIWESMQTPFESLWKLAFGSLWKLTFGSLRIFFFYFFFEGLTFGGLWTVPFGNLQRLLFMFLWRLIFRCLWGLACLQSVGSLPWRSTETTFPLDFYGDYLRESLGTPFVEAFGDNFYLCRSIPLTPMYSVFCNSMKTLFF